MKLSQYKNEDALDLIMDIMDPVAEILGDANFAKLAQDESANKMTLAKEAIKNHKKAVIQILATLNGVPVEEYQGTPMSMIKDALEILSDEELTEFFISQGQKKIEA